MTIENIGWSLGNYCNARCKHCYSWRTRKGSASLTEEEIGRIIDQIARSGVKTVNLGGNEPIYTDGPDIAASKLPTIIESLAARGIAVGITTNGVTAVELARRWPETFKKVNDWDVSLDSPYRDEHNANRRADLYDTALEALTLCSRAGKPKAIIACGMQWNLDEHHLAGFLDLARAYDAELRINTLKPTEAHHARDLPSPRQYYAAFSYLLGRTDGVVIGESTLAAMTDKAARGCPCGVASLRIHSKTPEGTVPVSPCVYLADLKSGDLLRDDLETIVASEQFACMRRRNEKTPDSCTGCQLRERCRGGCAARAYLVRGSLDARDPYCPLEAKDAGIEIPYLPEIVVGHDGVRVHENYLCTWIGRPKPDENGRADAALPEAA